MLISTKGSLFYKRGGGGVVNKLTAVIISEARISYILGIFRALLESYKYRKMKSSDLLFFPLSFRFFSF